MSYTKSLNEQNKKSYIYIEGDEGIAGSKRFTVDVDTNMAEVQKLELGVWQPSSLELGADSLWIGKNVGVGGVGHHLVTESNDGHIHFHAHSEVRDGVSIADTKIVTLYSFTTRYVDQSDESQEWTGTEFHFHPTANLSHTLASKFYCKTGVTPATENVRVRTWQGEDHTGRLVFDQWYPASIFIANSEVELDEIGSVEFEGGLEYHTIIESSANFSLKVNAAQTLPWYAADISIVSEDSLLQTAPWVDGYTWTEGDYFIDGRKIYVCNVTGVQSGLFTDNSAKWDEVGNSISSKIPLSEKGVADGVATLTGAGKVPISQLPTGTTTYKGVWDALTNTPTLADGTGTAGDSWTVGVAGTQDLGSGNITFDLNDHVIYNGTIWEKSANESHWTKVGSSLSPKVVGDNVVVTGGNIDACGAGGIDTNFVGGLRAGAALTTGFKNVIIGSEAGDVIITEN